MMHSDEGGRLPELEESSSVSDVLGASVPLSVEEFPVTVASSLLSEVVDISISPHEDRTKERARKKNRGYGKVREKPIVGNSFNFIVGGR